MTWLKTGDEFALDCADLSDAAYRTHHEALTWVMHRERGPFLAAREIRRFAESPDWETAVKELVGCGFWDSTPGGYTIRHGMDDQPSPDEIRQRREATRERNRRYRQRSSGRGRPPKGGDAS